RVHDEHVGLALVVGRFVSARLEQPGHAFAVMKVHLTAERLNQVLTRHVRLSLSPTIGFRFRLSSLFRLSARPASRAPTPAPAARPAPPQSFSQALLLGRTRPAC